MKLINKLYLLFVIAFLVGSSCKDDAFIEEDPETFYTIENSYNTVSQVDASVTNMYVHIRYWFQINLFMKGIGSDNMDAPYWRSGGSGSSNFSTWSTSSNPSYSMWSAFYQLVSYANETLEGADSENITWDSEDDYNFVIAQSKFFRGMAYMTLGEIYGGVPLVDKFYTYPKYDFTRSTREETYLFAIKDLREALDGMPDYPSEAGRVGKGATYHYLSEACLALANELDDNTTYLDSAIYYASKTMELHSLMTSRFGERATEGAGSAMNGIDAYFPKGNVFFDLFQRGNLDYAEGNMEALWTLQNDYALYLAYGDDDYLAYPRNFSPDLRDVHWDADHTDDGGYASPWQSSTDAYVGGRGIAAYSPTDYMKTVIWAGDYADDMRNDSVNLRREFRCEDSTSSYYGQVVTTDMLDESTLERMYPVWTKWAPIDDWGYEDLENGGIRSNMYRDDYATRLAETYLLRAEAYYRKGDLASAAADINVLRSRAQCGYMVTAGDMSIDLILAERARELFIEERRWCTLLRMGGTVAQNQINTYSYYAGTESDYYQGASAQMSGWSLFPIPQQEIDSNVGAVIEQNEGWY